MIRWLVVLALAAGALAFAAPVLERLAAGLRGAAPPGGAQSLRSPSVPSAARPGAGATTLYRWRDANGTLHVESAPPPAGVAAEAIRVQRAPAAPAVAPPPPGPALADNPLSVYTPAGRDALLRQIDETARMLEERNRQAQSLGSQL